MQLTAPETKWQGIRSHSCDVAPEGAEDGAVTVEGPALSSFAAGAEPLHDDFAPADQKLTIPFA